MTVERINILSGSRDNAVSKVYEVNVSKEEVYEKFGNDPAMFFVGVTKEDFAKSFPAIIGSSPYMPDDRVYLTIPADCVGYVSHVLGDLSQRAGREIKVL